MSTVGSITSAKQSTKNKKTGRLNQTNKKLQMNLEQTSNQAKLIQEN